MSHEPVTNDKISPHLAQDVPISQLDDELSNDGTDKTFIDAQLAFAKSKQGKQSRKRSYYHKQRWQVGNKGGKGGNDDRE